MEENRKTWTKLLLGLLLLAAVSGLRQYYLHRDPGNRVYPYVVHGVYLALLLPWGLAVSRRLSQKSLRLCFYGEFAAMVIWEAVRFLQVTVLADRMYLLRVSGYWMIFPVVMTPLMGFYFSLFLSRGQDYQLPRGWYLLTIGAAALILTNLTNEYHHFLFRTLPGEPEVNLYFHPNWGFLVLAAWIVVLMTARIVIIFEKSRRNRDYPHLRYFPFIVSLLFVAVTLPNLAASLFPGTELMELSAKLYYLEVLMWESCIMVGMIPVNRQYGQVFERSTAAMQIADFDGRPLVASGKAPVLSGEVFGILRDQGVYETENHQQLHIHPLRDGAFLWQEDHSQLCRIMEDLQKTAGELEAEGVLLQEEIRTRSEEGRVEARSRIYDTLTAEIQPQLCHLEALLESSGDNPEVWKQICLLGTFVKRYCNLRLICQETGSIPTEDLRCALEEYLACLRRFGTRVTWKVAEEIPHSPEFILRVLKALQKLAEQTRLSTLELEVGAEARITAGQTSPSGEVPDEVTVIREEGAYVEA